MESPCNLFNMCVKTISAPDCWNNVIIVLLYQTKCKNECNKYNGINLLSMLEKCWTEFSLKDYYQ